MKPQKGKEKQATLRTPVSDLGYGLLEKRDVHLLNDATRHLEPCTLNESLGIVNGILRRISKRKDVAVKALNDVKCGDYVRYGGDDSAPTKRVDRLAKSLSDISRLYEEAAEAIKSVSDISQKRRNRLHMNFKIAAEIVNGTYRKSVIDRLHNDTQLVSNRGFLICRNRTRSKNEDDEDLRWAAPSVRRQAVSIVDHIHRKFLRKTDASDGEKTKISKRVESIKKDILRTEPEDIAGTNTSRNTVLTRRMHILSSTIRGLKARSIKSSAISSHTSDMFLSILDVFVSSMHRIYQQVSVLPSVAHIIVPESIPDTGIPIGPFMEPDEIGLHPELVIGVYGGGYLKLDKGCEDCPKYGAYVDADGTDDPTDPSTGPREYTLDIKRTMKNLICRNMKVIVIELDMFPGSYTDFRSGTHWNRLIDVLRYVRDELGNSIDVVVGLKSRHLLGETQNRWGISKSTAAPNATEQWKIAINEIGDLREGLGSYSYLVDPTTGIFECLKGVMWDDFSLDFAKWNIYTEYKYHTRENIREMYEVAASRGLFIGGVMYFDKFARAFAKDGIELGLSGPCPYEGGDTAGRMPLGGLSANYYIPTRKFWEIGTEYYIKFVYYCRTGTNWRHTSGSPKLRMRCRFNEHDVMSTLIDFSDSCSGVSSSEVPVVFPDTHVLGDCDHVCAVATVAVPKYYITRYLDSDPFQRLSFILEPNPAITWVDGPVFDGDTVLNVWSIEIEGDHPSRGKIKFDDVREIPLELSPISAISSLSAVRVQFAPTPTFSNAIVLGLTEKYNVSKYLTPFIGFPKWCKYLYNYRLNTINNSIAENCDLDYYAWVRMRSWGYEYDTTKLIRQFESARLFGRAKALLAYNDPMFVTDIDSSALEPYNGVFTMKPSRKPRFSNVLWWTPYHGAFEGFYQEFTTVETFASGTELRANVLMEGSVVDWDRSAFSLAILDELSTPYELTYRDASGLEIVEMDGTVVSSWPSDAATRATSGIEWGNPDTSITAPWAKTHLRFSTLSSGSKVRLRLEIREEARGLGATGSFGVWFNLQKKTSGEGEEPEEWATVDSYDYSSGYEPSYKRIYEDIAGYLTSLT